MTILVPLGPDCRRATACTSARGVRARVTSEEYFTPETPVVTVLTSDWVLAAVTGPGEEWREVSTLQSLGRP